MKFFKNKDKRHNYPMDKYMSKYEDRSVISNSRWYWVWSLFIIPLDILTLYHFNKLELNEQLTIVWNKGVFVDNHFDIKERCNCYA